MELIRELSEPVADVSLPMSPGELRAALAKLRRAQRDAPAELLAPLFCLIGTVCHRLCKFGEALDAHRNAARYDSSNALHLINAANCLIELRRFREALDCLRDARARPRKGPGAELGIFLTAAEVHHHLGEHSAARSAFDEALSHVDSASHAELFRVAIVAAAIGAEDDATELFARYLAVARGIELGETPAIELIRTSPQSLKTAIAEYPALRAALAHVGARHDEPPPAEHQVNTQIALSPDAFSTLLDLVERPPEPTATLRRLFDESRP
jgi:tetratricopeptide (TPR) repeat protein